MEISLRTKKILYVLFIFVLILIPIVIIGVRINENNEEEEKVTKGQINVVTDENQIDTGDKENIELVATMDNTNALDLLKQSHEVVYDEYDFGVFIKSIDELEGNNENYWAFYINDNYAESAIDKTTLNTGDRIKLVYEKVDTSLF